MPVARIVSRPPSYLLIQWTVIIRYIGLQPDNLDSPSLDLYCIAPSHALLTMLDSMQAAVATSLTASAALWILYKIVSGYGRRAKGLPPGPPTVPLLGNLLDMSPSAPHMQLSIISFRT